jgi:hypothetical protein
MQECFPAVALLKRPLAHGVQPLAPDASLDSPSGQSSHVERPVLCWNVPALHS